FLSRSTSPGDHSTLTGRVRSLIPQAHDARGGGNVKHLTTAVPHVGEGCLIREERASRVDTHHPVPGVERYLLGGTPWSDARCVNHYVEASKDVSGLCEGRVDRTLVRHVALNKSRLARLCDPMPFTLGDIERDHLGTECGKRPYETFSHPAGASGDDNAPILQNFRHR